jgi:hypothetical protein
MFYMAFGIWGEHNGMFVVTDKFDIPTLEKRLRDTPLERKSKNTYTVSRPNPVKLLHFLCLLWPRLAESEKTLCRGMRRLWQTAKVVASTNEIPVHSLKRISHNNDVNRWTMDISYERSAI